jgi:ATP-binding cassette subfamily B protein
MLWFLVAGWKAGWATSGDIVFVMFTVFNVMMMTWTLGTELPQIFGEIGICRQGLSMIKQTYDVVDAPNAKPLKVTRGEIVFDDVHFHYRTGHDLFQGKSLTIFPGECVALVGLSGSGKSTFVNLILRLYNLEKGQIRIDGQNIAHVTQHSLREAIAMIPQDTTLFHRTLMDNIRYGNVNASDSEVVEAAKRAHCHEFIMETEQGYKSLVGERGFKLSGGQRQRIAIARALLKNAPILILDEATSALDSITERKIQESLHNLMENRTTLVIAHRLSTLSSMSRILVFKNGEIIEDGSHRDLLMLGRHYATLWNMQAGGFLPE